MCDAFYRFPDGTQVECEIIEPIGHVEHRGYHWRSVSKSNAFAIGEIIRWQDKDEGGELKTNTLQYNQSEHVVLRQALGRFVQAGYDNEAERIRGAIAQQLIRKLSEV